MKKLLMMLLSVTFIGSTAMAFEGVFVPTEDGDATIQPLAAKTCSEKPVPNGNYCTPAGKSCPKGYDQMAKLCWGGWHKGFYRCGVSCKPLKQCPWGPRGDCSRSLEKAGDHARARNFSTMSGALQLQENGEVAFLGSKGICKDHDSASADSGHTCTPSDGDTCYSPYKRMHKYCWGGWKKGLYRCGIVCSLPQRPTEN